MKLKAFIFDLDGTLADTLPLCIKSFQETLKEVTGIYFEEEKITAHFGKTEEGIVKIISPDNWQECLNTYIEIYKKNHHLCSGLFDGIAETLTYIKDNGYKLAMVTGKGKPTAEITLEYFGIRDYFDFVETGSPTGLVKTEGINKILENWKINPLNVAYVGDTTTDITESKKAGVIQIAVSWASTTNHNELLEHDPHLIFSKIEDFRKWLNNL